MTRLPDPAVERRWSRLIQLHEKSDLTIARFCDQHGVSTASFYQWRRKIRSAPDRPGEFLAVEIGGQRPTVQEVRVRFPCGTQIELDPEDSKNLQLIVERLTLNSSESAQ